MIIELLILLAIIWMLIFVRPASHVWALIIGIVLLVDSLYFDFNFGFKLFLWITFGLLAALANITALRKLFISRPFYKYFRRVLPPMSITEREALEAGDVWWEGDLFTGRPNWNKLHAIPKPLLTKEEQSFIDNQVKTFCSLVDEWQITQVDCDLSPAAWAYLKKEGFWALVIDKKYGGRGFSALAHSEIVTRIATRSMSAAVTVMVPNSLGPGELLHHYGTQEQKDYYLPRLARAEEVPCFALTSVAGGSDAGAMQDQGVVCLGQYQGQEVLGIRMSWSKRYITLAPIATVLAIAFKLYDPEHLLGQKEDIGITVCLLPTNYPGVEIGLRHNPCGVAFMNGPTSGQDVFIPLDFIIGGPKMVGRGWRMLMECLSIGRAISLPALSAGVGYLSYHSTGMYASLRKQFKVSLGQFEGVQELMAEIAGYTYLLDVSRRMTASAVDLKVKPSVASAIQKYHATELARVMIDHAMDIQAGRAVQMGPRNYLASSYFAIPVAITVEGANILTRNLIIFGQGAIRCHPYIFQEMEAASIPVKSKGLQKFDQALKSHLGYTLSNVIRTISFGVTNARFVRAPRTVLAPYYRQLTRMSSALAMTSDFAMLLLGGELKRKESLSARLGDILSHLYLASTLLKHYADEGAPVEELPYVEWGLQMCLYQIQQAFDYFFLNFKPHAVARSLKRMIFPFGRVYRAPSDQLGSQLAQSMMVPSKLRERLGQHVYSPEDPNDAIGRLVCAYNLDLELAPVRQKIKQAVVNKVIKRSGNEAEQTELAYSMGVITLEEKAKMLKFINQLQDALEVDSFEPNYLANRMCKSGERNG
jgi:acyl-CoA dehydrogenase